ncbi:Serine/arginine-rich splicing factor RS31 [Phytophthora citrophthora]|uniref:Serine/arginine-rich splicing factor RS31 n=1 Tax=Phytophthora citrophthora TaxID=4793 RepID=A0AAD9GM35_9STRA|nr:Serine/arginine-rich splicing factor RS31 [Phytophthora citrophthora]
MTGPMASTKLYVGNLFYELTQDDVEAEFGKFGPIEQCAVKKGYAFVHYEQLEDAELAVREMNDKELGGRRLRVAFAVSHGTQRRYDGPSGHQGGSGPSNNQPPLLNSPRFPVNASPNLFVANIPPHIKMSELDQAFAQFGEVHNVKVLPQARPDAPMSAFVDYTDISSAQKAHSATIIVAGQHLRTDYNFRKNRGDGPKRATRGNIDANGSYNGEERGGRPRYDSFDSQSGRKSRYEDEMEESGHRRHHHHRHSSRHHSSRHSREDPEERGSPSRYRRHSSSSSLRRGEERERSRDYGGERSYGRPDEVEEFQQPERRSQSGYYESRSRGEERVPREYVGRGMDKSSQEYRRYGRPEMSSSRHGSRRGPRNDRSWSPPPSGGPRSRSRSR